jgi:hypothetical protein
MHCAERSLTVPASHEDGIETELPNIIHLGRTCLYEAIAPETVQRFMLPQCFRHPPTATFRGACRKLMMLVISYT